MGRSVFITGSNNVVEGAENFAAINCQDQEFTSEHSGQTVMNNGSLVVTDESVEVSVPMTAAISPRKLIKTSHFDTDANTKNYFVDASGGNVIVTILDYGIDYTFVKVDASANTVSLDPQNGNINGISTYELTAQYQRATTLWDGTDYYV